MNLSFKYIYKNIPEELKISVDKMRYTEQSSKWHPEGNVYNHTKIVLNRAVTTGNPDLIVAAFFHDIGKIDTTFINKKGVWAAHGHEFASLKYVEKYKNFIESLGANYNAVWNIVKEHMRIQKFNDMRPHKQKKLAENPYYNLICRFSEFDNMLNLTEKELQLIQ